MPRKTRMYVPGVPAHVVQRGNNREPCFFAQADYGFYLSALMDALERYEVELHAYVLMTNHVHLLMTPKHAEGISRVMQHVGRLYVRHVNETYVRTGTLWEGRHKASLIEAEDYLLSCYRYIELNPVRAGMVLSPDEYAWSSYRWHAWGQEDSLIVDHPIYLAMSPDAAQRQKNYRALFEAYVATDVLEVMRDALTANYPIGNSRFKERIMQELGRSIGQNRRGRPAKSRVDDC